MTCGWRQRETVETESHGCLLPPRTLLMRIWLLKQDEIVRITGAALWLENARRNFHVRSCCVLKQRRTDIMSLGVGYWGSDIVCLQNNMYAFGCRGQTFRNAPASLDMAEFACWRYKRPVNLSFLSCDLPPPYWAHQKA